MKKSIFIIASLAAVIILSSFVMARNVTSNKLNNNETIYVSDEWEYYKPVTVYTDGGSGRYTHYIWKKTVCGDPDYLISWSDRKPLTAPQSISKNYRYGKEQDWTTEYKYTASMSGNSSKKCYFSTYLQGWE